MGKEDGYANLVPFSLRTKEEASQMGRKGGKASGRVRNARKTFREQLKSMLSCRIPKDSPLYGKMKKQMDALGIKGDPLVQDMPLLGMLMRSVKDHKAAEFVRDTAGEKPTEQFEDVTPVSPIVLELPSAERIEEIKRLREERNDAEEKKR